MDGYGDNLNPQLGEIRKSIELGYKSLTNSHIWHACEKCGKKRWVLLVEGNPKTILCKCCAQKGINNVGSKSARWGGGRHKNKQGYVLIRVFPNDFFAPMVSYGGYVMEHRLVMAKSLGRCLHRWELVHHKNHIKDDNRLENLQLVSDDRHQQITLMENRIRFLESRVTQLEADIVLVRGANNVLISK